MFFKKVYRPLNLLYIESIHDGVDIASYSRKVAKNEMPKRNNFETALITSALRTWLKHNGRPSSGFYQLNVEGNSIWNPFNLKTPTLTRVDF